MSWWQRLRARVRGPSTPGADITDRLHHHGGRLGDVERDLARIGPQVAALETRVEDLRHRLVARQARPEEVAEASSLVDEIRREHERMRARVTAATRFEERLERLEEEIAAQRRVT